jgi:hypothetical protein
MRAAGRSSSPQDDSQNQQKQSEGGERSPRQVRVFPLIPERRPVGGRSAAGRASSKEMACGRANRLSFEPVFVHRLSKNPEDDVHREQRNKGAQDEPEYARAYRRQRSEQPCDDDGNGLGGADQGESRVVDPLDDEIVVAIQSPLSWKLKHVRYRRRGGQGDDHKRKYLERRHELAPKSNVPIEKRDRFR